jgi:hypothetical protein
VGTRPARVIALLQAKDEEQLLPGMLQNVAPLVDGIVALDDGSTDATYSILSGCEHVLEVLRNPAGGAWDEYRNQVSLVHAGRRYAPDWFFCVDADVRIERRFADIKEGLIRRAKHEGVQAYAFHLRELWNDALHYRVDGIWGQKVWWTFFRNIPTHSRFDPRIFHRKWMPLDIVDTLETVGRHSGLNIYHLGMITAQDRERRARKWESLDPDHCSQTIGYSYLTDETNIVLERVAAGREFIPPQPVNQGRSARSSVIPLAGYDDRIHEFQRELAKQTARADSSDVAAAEGERRIRDLQRQLAEQSAQIRSLSATLAEREQAIRAPRRRSVL